MSAKAEHYQALLTATREKATKDKDALKEATRIQRDRAEKQEDIGTKLKAQLGDLMAQVRLRMLTQIVLSTYSDRR